MMNYARVSSISYTPVRRPTGFTLIEVLISLIIFAIGLIGLSAVFPVVITQQRDAQDLSMAISAGESAESILATRFGNFAGTISQITDDRWHRIAAWDPGGQEEPYLRMPRVTLRDSNGALRRNVRLGLSRIERGLSVQALPGNNLLKQYDLVLPRRPLSRRSEDIFQVKITIQPQVGKLISYTLTPAGPGATTFITEPGFESRLAPSPNKIEYQAAHLQFNVKLQNTSEKILSTVIDYTWLDPRVIAHVDRLFPSDLPRYGWDVAIRRGPNGQAQYCLFVYRFDGPKESNFVPEIPKNESDPRHGMLRLGRVSVRYVSSRRRFFLDDPSPNTDEARAIQAGVYLLPEYGNAPVKVLRAVMIDGTKRWELDAPPVGNDGNGNPQILVGDVKVIYMPSSYFLPVEQETWKISPLLAYTKQVDL